MNVPNCTYVLSVVIHAKATMICDDWRMNWFLKLFPFQARTIEVSSLKRWTIGVRGVCG